MASLDITMPEMPGLPKNPKDLMEMPMETFKGAMENFPPSNIGEAVSNSVTGVATTAATVAAYSILGVTGAAGAVIVAILAWPAAANFAAETLDIFGGGLDL